MRRISKGRKRDTNTHVNLDTVTDILSYKKDLSLVFDPKKLNVESRIGRIFLIIGPHESDPSKPSLLFVYPCHEFPYCQSTFSRITQFCYPDGMKKASSSDSFLVNQFVFGLNEENGLLFGICTHFTLKPKPHFLSAISDSTLFCMCVITPIPQLSAHFQFQSFLIGLLLDHESEVPMIDPERYVSSTQMLDDISVEPRYFNDSEARLSGFIPPLHPHEENQLFAAINTIYIPKVFLFSVEIYMGLKIDLSMSNTYRLSESIHMQVSTPKDSMKEIAMVCFDVLFSSLDVQDIVRYFRALITEQRVLIVSENINILSYCVLAGLALVHPMTFKGAILPILPNDPDFLEYIDTPVPYVFGALSTQLLSQIVISPDITMINIDTKKVYYPDDMPHMPNAGELRKQLKDLLTSLDVVSPSTNDVNFWMKRRQNALPIHIKRKSRLKYSFLPSDTERIFRVFRQFTEPLVNSDRLAGCRVRDTTDPDNPAIGFVKEVYMITVRPEDVEFIEMFVSTQTFQGYCEETFFA